MTAYVNFSLTEDLWQKKKIDSHQPQKAIDLKTLGAYFKKGKMPSLKNKMLKIS